MTGGQRQGEAFGHIARHHGLLMVGKANEFVHFLIC